MLKLANTAIVVAWAKNPNDFYALERILRGIDTVAVNAVDVKPIFPCIMLLPTSLATTNFKMRGNR
jgi:hypothetical protein